MCDMKLFPGVLSLLICLFSCASVQAQSTGRVECARDDSYVYLHSSITTLEIRASVQCNEIVQITGRYDNYCSVRTTRGDVYSSLEPRANQRSSWSQPTRSGIAPKRTSTCIMTNPHLRQLLP
jgi:hypothetical protein